MCRYYCVLIISLVGMSAAAQSADLSVDGSPLTAAWTEQESNTEVLVMPLLTSSSTAEELSTAKVTEDSNSLKLIFFGIGGIYLTNVRVVIHDVATQKKKFEAATCLPIFLSKLPRGTYQVDAMVGDFIKTQNITLTGAAIHTRIIRLPIYGQPDNWWRLTVTNKTPLHELLNALDFAPNIVEEHCS